MDVAISKLELNLPNHVHPFITHPQQREVRKLSVSPTPPKESQRQDVPFVLEPSHLKFEDLQDPGRPGLPGGVFSPATICLNGSVRSGLLPRLTGHRLCRDSAEARSTRRIIDLLLPPVMQAKERETTASRPRIGQIPASPSLLPGARAAPIRRAVSQRNANEPLKTGSKGMASSLALPALLTASRVCSSKLH